MVSPARRPLAALAFAGLVPLLSTLPIAGCGTGGESGASSADSTTADVRALRSLPYLDWNPMDAGTEEAGGVVRHDPDKAWVGYNLYNSRPRSRAVLMDMMGQEVHAWARDEPEGWHHVEMAPDGALFTILKDRSLSKLDWDSNLLWTRELRAHHDLALAENGEVYVLRREDGRLELGGRTLPIVDDVVEVLSTDGEPLRRYRISALFADRVDAERARIIEAALREDERAALAPGGACDVFHTNSIELVPGGALLSVRELDLIAMVDLERGEVVWSWGPGTLEQQHQPTLTSSGTVLVFDNGTRREWSRILEYAPERGEVVWEYGEGPDGDFYSYSRGGCQALLNGNVLVTESNKGRVFEVDREGEVVWEFYNPERRRDKRAAIYRMARIEPSVVEPLLARGEVARQD